MYLACLAYCHPPEPTDTYYLSLLFASSCSNSKYQANLCDSKSEGPHVKAVGGGRGSWASSHVSGGQAQLWEMEGRRQVVWPGFQQHCSGWIHR